MSVLSNPCRTGFAHPKPFELIWEVAVREASLALAFAEGEQPHEVDPGSIGGHDRLPGSSVNDGHFQIESL